MIHTTEGRSNEFDVRFSPTFSIRDIKTNCLEINDEVADFNYILRVK